MKLAPTVTKPVDVPTRATVAFIASYLPSGTAILEVGCGEGHVARELLNRGYQVTGIDSDREVIARAQARGVSTFLAPWPEFECSPVDAVAFTRSLHHIGELTKAILKTREVLRPTGIILVEDFGFDEADEVTINWFLEVLGSQTARTLITPVQGEFVTDLLGAGDPVIKWHQSHDHDLHTAAAMNKAVGEYFTIRRTQSVPYLYRYLVAVLPETTEAAIFVEEIFREEARLGKSGAIVQVGRRIVGSLQEG